PGLFHSGRLARRQAARARERGASADLPDGSKLRPARRNPSAEGQPQAPLLRLGSREAPRLVPFARFQGRYVRHGFSTRTPASSHPDLVWARVIFGSSSSWSHEFDHVAVRIADIEGRAFAGRAVIVFRFALDGDAVCFEMRAERRAVERADGERDM